jgi:anti-sigma regulatory factor (Ser/Thr protein kinase)
VEVTECHDLEHDADVGSVRRRFSTLASLAGHGEARANDAAVIASELASNVLKHAQHGGALLGRDRDGIAIAAWDRGPGMNIAASVRDGVSTAGTSGNGLGAVTRLATSWDAYAPAGRGAVVTARLADAGMPSPVTRVEAGGVSLPYPGLPICGDAWTFHVEGAIATVLVVDGLGHGEGAAEAAAAGVAAFGAGPNDSPTQILERVHRASRGTRGAAATCVRIDLATRTAACAGAGNVGAWIIGERQRQLVTQHGTLGQASPTLREEVYPFPPGALLVVASDGIKSRWSLADYPGLEVRSPLAIATVLWRDFTRGRDDVTVAVLRERTG